MHLLCCDRCERTQPVEEALAWLRLTRDGDASTWDFCSVRCLAEWATDAG